MLTSEENSNILSFECDQEEINLMKKAFIAEGGSYLYFRKGEFAGFFDSLQFAVDLAQNTDWYAVGDIVWQGVENYAILRAFAEYIRKDSNKASEHFSTTLNKVKKFSVDLNLLMKIGGTPFPSTRATDFRIICTKDPYNENYLSSFEVFGAQIKLNPSEKKGRHRLFLNDKRFCFFIRENESTFYGFMGSDPLIMKKLKSDFENEWNSLKEQI